MRVERLPFTVYDILGYFFPGFLFLIGLYHTVPTLSELAHAHTVLISSSFFRGSVGLLILVTAAYTLGHLLSWGASLTVERFVIWMVGYPSQYLLSDEPRKWMRPRSLGKLAKEKFKSRFEVVFGTEAKNNDWFEVVDHHVRNHSFAAAARMYNYVVLYGFLRNTAFVSFVIACLSLPNAHLCPPNVDLGVTAALLLLGCAATVAFQKYYRRYSTEVIMSFAVGVGDQETQTPALKA